MGEAKKFNPEKIKAQFNAHEWAPDWAREWAKGWKTRSKIAGVLAVIAVGAWGIQQLEARMLLSKADRQIKKGFTALAAETLDPVREILSSSERGCGALVNAYFGARRAERLEWASQACLDAGVETSDVYLGLAASRELTGRDGESLQILDAAAKKFDKSPDAFYRMVQLFHRAKDEPRATEAAYQAALRAGNNQISLEALGLLAKQERWADARKMADMLKGAETEDPEVKLLVARALFRGGDKSGAEVIVQQARALLVKHPEAKGKLEIAYADMLPAKASLPLAGEEARYPSSSTKH